MIELLLTVVFVAFSSVMVQGSFLRAADLFGRYSHTLQIMVWADRQTAAAREAFLRDDSAPPAGEMMFSGKTVTAQDNSRDLAAHLRSIRYAVSWAESGRPFTYYKEIYVHKRDLALQP